MTQRDIFMIACDNAVKDNDLDSLYEHVEYFDKSVYPDDVAQHHHEYIWNAIKLLETKKYNDSVSNIAKLVGTAAKDVHQIIDYVQLLLNQGLWFTDACEIVAILTPLKSRFANFEDPEKMGEFWDFVSDNCVVPDGVELRTDLPVF